MNEITSQDNSQTVFNILSQVVLQGTNFILIMIFTRYMSTDGYGIVSIYQAYATFFMTIIGLSVQGTVGTAFVHLGEKEYGNYLASIFMLACSNYVVINIVAFIFKDTIIGFTGLDWFLIVLMLAYSFGCFCFNFITISYVYKRKAQISCLFALGISLLMIIASWISIDQIAIKLPEYLGRILAITCPYLLCIVVVGIIIFKEGNPLSNLKSSLSFCIPMSMPLVLHSISSVLLGQTDKIMLQRQVKDNSIVGIYSFIITFVHILNSIYVALNNTWIPIYYRYLKKLDLEHIKKRSRRYFDFFTALCSGFILISPEMIKLFADKSYWNGLFLIPIAAFSIFLVFEYTFLVNFELYNRKTNWIAFGTVSAAILNVILNYFLIHYWLMYGAAVSTCISYLLLFVLHYICARRMGKDLLVYNIVFFIRNTLIMVIVCILFYFLLDYVVLRWIISTFIAISILYCYFKNKSLF